MPATSCFGPVSYTHLDVYKRQPYVWIAMFGLVSFGLIGFWDDYAKIKHKQNLGLTVKQKLGLQVLAALMVGFMLLALHAERAYSTSMNVPFFKSFKPDLLIDSMLRNWYTYPLAFVFFFAFMLLVIVGSSDAVNLTDGLDGLAIGLMLIASFAMTALTYVTGHAQFAEYLDLARLPGASELTIFCSSMVGASLGSVSYTHLRFDTPHIVEPDRAKAIRAAIREAGTGDILILAGKGHETYQVRCV